jgi:regulatory protein
MATYAEVYACAIRLLTRREHARAELLRKLLHRKFPVALCQRVVAACKAEGWQDDQRFAQHFTCVKHRAGWGPFYIDSVLQSLKIESSIIETVLASISQKQWIKCGRRWLNKRSYQGQSTLVHQKKQAALYRRGFDSALIAHIQSEIEL